MTMTFLRNVLIAALPATGLALAAKNRAVQQDENNAGGCRELFRRVRRHANVTRLVRGRCTRQREREESSLHTMNASFVRAMNGTRWCLLLHLLVGSRKARGAERSTSASSVRARCSLAACTPQPTHVALHRCLKATCKTSVHRVRTALLALSLPCASAPHQPRHVSMTPDPAEQLPAPARVVFVPRPGLEEHVHLEADDVCT